MDGCMYVCMYDCTTSDLAVMAESGSGFKLRYYESPVVRTTDVASCF